jgi:hypothetical protein
MLLTAKLQKPKVTWRGINPNRNLILNDREEKTSRLPKRWKKRKVKPKERERTRKLTKASNPLPQTLPRSLPGSSGPKVHR